MKGRTRCPECKHVFVLDISDGEEQHDAVCPRCDNKFTIKTSSNNAEKNEDCFWEEHGEPRKTILSSIKPKTNKPMIAMILMMCVFAAGITTAGLSETFIETSLDAASALGLKGDVEFNIMNKTNASISNITIKIDDKTLKTNNDGYLKIKKIKLGIKTAEIMLPETNQSFNYEIIVTPIFISSNHMNINTSKIKDVNFNTSGYSIIIIIFSIFALLGVLLIFKREHFDAAMIMSFLGIFSFGFFMIGSILTIIALYFIYKSRDEFSNGKKGKVF